MAVSRGRTYVKSGFAVAGPVVTGRAVMQERRPPRIVALPARRPRTTRRPRRTSRTSHGPPGREDPADDELAARLAGILAEFGPLPASALAAQVRRRKAAVLETLHTDSRFAWTGGKRRASRWTLTTAVRHFDAAEAAARWGIDLATAEEFIFGAEGFLELGFVRSLNGNGRVVVTERGLAAARTVRSLGPEAMA